MRSIIFVVCLLFASSFGLNAQESGGTQTNEVAQAPATQNPPASPDTGQGLEPQNSATSATRPSDREIADKVNNPVAPVTIIEFRNILVPSVAGADGITDTLEMQPIFTIRRLKRFPVNQLVKLSMPLYEAIPGPVNSPQLGEVGVGDFEVADLFTFKQSWGEWGFGPVLVFPTASSKGLGAGKYQIGPSVGLIYTSKENLIVGAIVQNPISYAGDANKPNSNNMIITPYFVFNLKQGWFLGLSDFPINFNWEHDGAATVPLGVQGGKIVTLGRQPFRLAFEVGGLAVRPAGTPNPGIILEFQVSPIFSFLKGSGEKIKLRKQN